MQCQKLLWFVYNAKDQIPEPDAAQQAIFDQAHAVGDLAKLMYADGIEVGKGIIEFDETLRSTEQLLKLRRPLFEAAFSANGGYCRVDILAPAPDGSWDLIEVKSTSAVKDVHLFDLAFQAWVLAAAGVKLRRCLLMHINGDYVRCGPVDPKQFFTLVDLSVEVARFNLTIADKLDNMTKTIRQPVAPEVGIGPQCSKPYQCPLHDQCWAFLPPNSVFDLYYGGKKCWRLHQDGVVNLKDIPESVSLTVRQTIQRNVALTGQPHIDRNALASFLNRLKYPVGYLDFETFNTSIPLFDGLTPYQQVPFQFSLHRVTVPHAKSDYHAFLADGRVDPRPAFLNRLRDCIGDEGSVVVYNQSFENSVLTKLAESFPEHAAWIENVKRRFVDLLVPFKQFYYHHPDQHGSASIKSVLPVLTGQSYADLEIREGGQASLEYLRVTFGDVPETERLKVRSQLEKYCSQDTAGMSWITDALRKLVD
ncbi:MAG TPA: DUF2779 domain-containing protein [Verrucomicrobiae bacterium]|nr:DUF2779 domain-containing protein [Verrucomicrobiae bacterium]